MSKIIALSDEQYRTIERVAGDRGESPEKLIPALVEGLRDRRQEPH